MNRDIWKNSGVWIGTNKGTVKSFLRELEASETDWLWDAPTYPELKVTDAKDECIIEHINGAEHISYKMSTVVFAVMLVNACFHMNFVKWNNSWMEKYEEFLGRYAWNTETVNQIVHTFNHLRGKKFHFPKIEIEVGKKSKPSDLSEIKRYAVIKDIDSDLYIPACPNSNPNMLLCFVAHLSAMRDYEQLCESQDE